MACLTCTIQEALNSSPSCSGTGLNRIRVEKLARLTRTTPQRWASRPCRRKFVTGRSGAELVRFAPLGPDESRHAVAEKERAYRVQPRGSKGGPDPAKLAARQIGAAGCLCSTRPDALTSPVALSRLAKAGGATRAAGPDRRAGADPTMGRWLSHLRNQVNSAPRAAAARTSTTRTRYSHQLRKRERTPPIRFPRPAHPHPGHRPTSRR
jgi:hypothetical protein